MHICDCYLILCRPVPFMVFAPLQSEQLLTLLSGRASLTLPSPWGHEAPRCWSRVSRHRTRSCWLLRVLWWDPFSCSGRTVGDFRSHEGDWGVVCVCAHVLSLHACMCVWLNLSCDQPQVISSEIVFWNGTCFVPYADMSRISFNNGKEMVVTENCVGREFHTRCTVGQSGTLLTTAHQFL